jgi:hypothetical protein
MAENRTHYLTRLPPIDRQDAIDRCVICGPARSLRSERLILTARINFNP